MRLEMHAHDCEVSPCAVIKAKELVDGYKEAGYDGIVITNHFDKGIMHLWGETTEEHYQNYLRGYELAKEEGERVGLRVILGMEIRLECGPEDYLVYGVTKDFIREHMDICGCSLQELYEICEENGCVLIRLTLSGNTVRYRIRSICMVWRETLIPDMTTIMKNWTHG